MGEYLQRIQNWECIAREATFRPSVMAKLCHISLRQLERHFAHEFRTTPGHWTREVRCRCARELLVQGWSSKAVALEFGFSDSAHFCREFRRIYGTSPRNFASVLPEHNGTGK
jgi:transcriptional regulator GlxA family with amidase domain